MVVENLIFNIKRQGDVGAASMTRMTASLKKLSTASKSAEGVLSKLGRALGRIALYRMLRTVIKDISSAFTEGLRNVYQYSKTIDSAIARSLDAISGAGLQMKNQMGAALGELIATIQPIVEAIISLVTRAADALAQLFALLGGRNVYHKATQSTKEWTAAAGGAAKAAKEWKNQLMGFDEINRLNEPSDAGGGGGGAASNIGNWELAPVDIDLGFLEKYVTETKKWFAQLDFEPMIRAWGRLKQAVMDFVGIVDQALFWAYKNVLLPLAKWTIEKAAPSMVKLLASAFELLNTVLKKVGPVFEDLWNKYMKPVAEWIGDKFVSTIDWLRETFESLTKKVEEADSFGEFLKSLEGKEELILSIAGAIATVVLAFAGFSLVSKIVEGFGLVLGLLTNPIALVILGIAALIWAGIELYQHWDEISAWFQETWDAIAAWWNDTVVAKFKEGAEELRQDWDNIKTKVAEIVDAIKSKIEEWKRKWQVHVAKNLERSEELRQKIGEVWDTFKEKIDEIKGKLQEWRDKASEVTDAIGGFFTNVMLTIGSIVNGILSAIDAIINACQRAWDAITSLGSVSVGNTTMSIADSFWGPAASGGFIDEGQMFIAREAGPELVGTIGGRTAVANNDQIVAGISSGVYNAVVSAMSVSGGRNSGPIVLNINGREFARATYADQQAVAREHGSRLVVNG